MAKVKDQIRDRSEVSYIDAAGRTCYLDELFRHIMPDAYPLPSLNPTGVARKSSRGHNGPTQGNGSPEQLPWRMCFQECADRWNALPDVCPAMGSCDETSSKKNVWDARQAQGVMCSYFDLYMSCCMKSCTKISITGPKGVEFTGGTIGSTEGCWPCPPVNKDTELSIGYTTQQMSANQQQTLTAEGLISSGAISCCAAEDLKWELVSGGGSLDPRTGPSTTYIAPAENPNCVENATIQLTDCYGRTATLEIAINTTTPDADAYEYWVEHDPESCETIGGSCWFGCGDIWINGYRCDGTLRRTITNCVKGGGAVSGGTPCSEAVCNYWRTQLECKTSEEAAAICGYANPVDVRSDAMKLAGCCPGQLF